jgi:hypothetical protein
MVLMIDLSPTFLFIQTTFYYKHIEIRLKMLILYICKVSSIHQQTCINKVSPQEILSQALPKLFLVC